MWLEGHRVLHKSMWTIKSTSYTCSSNGIPADSKDWAKTSLYCNYPIVSPGCSLLGSSPPPPLTRGLCLAPAGMSSCTHTWSSAHWEPCWTACTCTPSLWWRCMKTHTSTHIKNLVAPTETRTEQLSSAENRKIFSEDSQHHWSYSPAVPVPSKSNH